MGKWILNMLVAGMVALWTVPAWCEIYQYRDQNGVLRFTDDIASVPPDQRPGVTTRRSVESRPGKGEAASPAGKKVSASPVPSQQETRSSANTWEGKKARQMGEFDRKQAELDRKFTDLQNERTRLAAKAPSPKASFEEKAVYNRKVAALNARIDRYEEELAAFTQQVNAYNAKVKKQ